MRNGGFPLILAVVLPARLPPPGFVYSRRKLPMSSRRNAAFSSSSFAGGFVGGLCQTAMGLVAAVANSSKIISCRNAGEGDGDSSSVVRSMSERFFPGAGVSGTSNIGTLGAW